MWKCNKNVVGLFYPHKHKLKFAFMRKRHQKESDLLQDHDWPWIHIGCKISDTFFVCMNTKKNHGIFFQCFSVYSWIMEEYRHINSFWYIFSILWMIIIYIQFFWRTVFKSFFWMPISKFHSLLSGCWIISGCHHLLEWILFRLQIIYNESMFNTFY